MSCLGPGKEPRHMESFGCCHLAPLINLTPGSYPGQEWGVEALVHKPGPLTTPVLWLVCLSCLFLAGVRDFTYLCFVASHPLPNAQPIPLVVRESLRPMKDLSENLPDCLPPLLAECLCGIKLVFLVGMGPGSEIRAAQKGQDCGRLSEMGYTLRNGRSLTSPSPGGRKKAIRNRSGSIFPKVCLGHSCWGFFLLDTKHRGRKEGREAQCPHRHPRGVLPPSRVSACHKWPPSLPWIGREWHRHHTRTQTHQKE